MGISYTEIKDLTSSEVDTLIAIELAQKQREQDAMNAHKGQLNARR